MRRGRMRQPRWFPVLVAASLLVAAAAPAAAWEGAHWRHLLEEDEDVSGPVVRDTEADLAAAGPLSEPVKVNATEKKTIAQIIDEALEQEFPEEKQEGIGKNYNATAKNADVRAAPQPPAQAARLELCYIQWRMASTLDSRAK